MNNLITLTIEEINEIEKKYIIDSQNGFIYNKGGYIIINRTIMAHRLIYEYHHKIKIPERIQVDHIDRDRLNNKISNLRLVTNQQNAQNKRNITGNWKGVFWVKKKKKWRSELVYNYKSIHLGYYDNELDGAKAYNSFAQFLNENENCIYLLNDIKAIEPNYILKAKNIPELNKQKILENKSSKYIGVTKENKRVTYSSNIKYNTKNYYLGSFCNEIEAANRYNEQAKYLNENNNCKYKLNNNQELKHPIEAINWIEIKRNFIINKF